MANIVITKELSGEEKITQMQLDARFDVADDNLVTDESVPGLASVREITSKKAPPKVPKVFLANDCVFNCAYCGCRNSREGRALYCNNPKELAKMAVQEALLNRRGIFLTSAIHKNADYTQELIIESIKSMRHDLNYQGYIHAKVMPGADPLLIRETGIYANRLSVNIEVAKSEGYSKVAKQKNKTNILTPMTAISDLISEAKDMRKPFAVSQTTQLMAGSVGEDDRTIMVLSGALYRKFKLSRVYYTPFQYQHPADGYELDKVATPSWRMKRLYQADRLLELYGFSPDDVTPDDEPFLQEDIDPKSAFALRHLDRFPVEVNKADYETLLRVPGIGVISAKRIVEARKHGVITHEILRRIGVSLKRSVYFITCGGKYMGGRLIESPTLRTYMSDIGGSVQMSMDDYTIVF